MRKKHVPNLRNATATDDLARLGRGRSDAPTRSARRPRTTPGEPRSAPSLDALDRHIIAALQADGRRAWRSIADELDVSESVVRYRTQRLEQAGILEVVGIANPLRIGFELMAMTGVKVEAGSLGAVCVELETLSETSYVAAVAGRFDVLIELVCRDKDHFQRLLDERIHLIPGVLWTESFLILDIHKMAYGWGAGENGVPLAESATDELPTPHLQQPRPDTTSKSRRKGST